MRNTKLLGMGFGALLMVAGACGDDSGATDDGCAAHDLVCLTPDAGEALPGIVTRTQSLHSIADATQLVGSATLTLDFNTNTATADVVAESLPVGVVVTLWWGAFNAPAACTAGDEALGADCGVPDMVGNADALGAVMFAGPAGYTTVDATGNFTFPTATMDVIEVGAAAHEYRSGPGPANGLNNLEGEIHLFIQKHGEPLTGDELTAQQSQFNGGCRMGETYAGQDPPACGLVEVAAFLPVANTL